MSFIFCFYKKVFYPKIAAAIIIARAIKNHANIIQRAIF
jgi:hypothetical protein